jgi:hypothetical protein
MTTNSKKALINLGFGMPCVRGTYIEKKNGRERGLLDE